MIRINLIPEPTQAAAARRHHSRAWAVAVGLAAVVAALPATTEWLRRAEIDRLALAHVRLQSELDFLRKETIALAVQSSQLQAHLDRADALRAKRAWSALLTLLADRTPAGCWYSTIATDPASPPASSQTRAPSAAIVAPSGSPPGSVSATKVGPVEIETPRKLRLSGFANAAGDPHTLAASLKETGVFGGVDLHETRLEQAPEGPRFRFELTCEW